jgi:hypothetical protein
MYRFVLGGMACACDTAEELRDAAGLRPAASMPAPTPGPRIKRRKYRRRKPVESSEVAEVAEEAPAKKRRKKRAKRVTKENTYNVADLPVIKEGISWEVVEKVAKRLGKKVLDKRQLRSDLLARKKME